jgi:hypothetical protein
MFPRGVDKMELEGSFRRKAGIPGLEVDSATEAQEVRLPTLLKVCTSTQHLKSSS